MTIQSAAPWVLVGILCLSSDPVSAQHVDRVEYGLLPAVLVSGRETPRYSIYDRMRHFAVPGVGIAVVSGGRFDWAEGYGVKVAGGTDSVGYRCYFVMYPITGDGVVVMTNADAGSDLIMEIIRAVSDVYGWPDFRPETRAAAGVDVATLRKYEGEYEVEPGFSMTIRSRDDGLLARATRRFPGMLFPESDRVFFGTDVNLRIRFELDAAGTVSGFDILRGDSEIHATKIR